MHISRDKCKMEFPALAPPGSVTGVDASEVVRLNLLTLPPALEAQTMTMPMAANSNVASNSQNYDCGNLGSAIIIQPEEFKTEDVKKDVKKESVGVKQETYCNEVMEINGLNDIKPQPRLGDIEPNKHELIDIKPQPGLGDIKPRNQQELNGIKPQPGLGDVEPNKQQGLIDIKPQLGLGDIEPHDQQELNDIKPQPGLGDVEPNDRHGLIDMKPHVSEIGDSNKYDEKLIEADLVRSKQGDAGGSTQQTPGQYVESEATLIPMKPEANPMSPKPIEIIPIPEVPSSEGTELNLDCKKNADRFCQICNKLFDTIKNYKIHSNVHKEKRPFFCHVCPLRFLNEKGVRDHMRHHYRDNYYPCGLCGQSFSEKSRLRSHLVREHPRKKYQCKTCGEFLSRAERTTHNHKVKCEVCGKAYSDPHRLTLHKVNCKAAPSEKKYSCKVCRKEFNYQNERNAHMKTHEGERNVACQVCGEYFSFVSHRDKHVRKHHPEANYRECGYCGLRVKNLVTYKRHLKGHALRDAKVQCDSCSFKSRSKELMVFHKAEKHDGPLPRECPECTERFLTVVKLNKHIKEKHPQTYTYEVCTDANLNATKEEPPKYQCKYCQKTFAKKKKLWIHEKIHKTVVKALKCDFCDKTYNFEETRTFHIWEKHGGPMPYTCNHCGEGFTSMTKTANHIKTSHAPQKETGDDKSFLLSNFSTSDLKQEQQLTGESNYQLNDDKGCQGREIKTEKLCNTQEESLVCPAVEQRTPQNYVS